MAKAIKTAVKVFVVTVLIVTGVAFLLGTTTFALTGFTALQIAGYSALSALVGGLMSKGTNATSENFGTKVATRTATAPRQIIYGKARVGGTITHIETSGTDNYKLSMIVVLAGHEVESLEEVLVNDVKLTTTSSGGFQVATNSKFVNTDNENNFGSGRLLRYKFLDGSQTSADATVTSNTSLDNNDKFTGLAYMLIQFVFDSEAFGGGIPPLSFVIKGKKVYDPRSGETAYTDSNGKDIGTNPALCVRDYLTNTTYGLKATSSEINDTTALGGFASAANTCETAAGAITTATVNGAISSSTTVTIDTAVTNTLIDIGQTVTGTGITGTVTVIKRTGLVVTLSSAVTIADGVTLTFNEGSYIANGITNMTADGAGVIEGLLSSCAGKMSYINGKFVMFAGASVTPEMTITDDNLLAPISITTKQASGETFNTVKAVYVDGNNNYVATDSPTETTVNPATSVTFLSEDTPTGESQSNYRKNLEIQLPFTDNTTLAQRLQRIAILHSRQEVALSVLCNIAYMQLQPFDWVYLTNERLGYTNKVFEVLSTNLEVMEQNDVPMLATRLDLKEIDSSVYAFASSSYTSPIDEGSSVPTGSFSVTAPTNLSLTVDLQLDSTTSKVNIDASWTNNPDDLIQGTEILYGTSSGTYIGSILVGKGKTKAVIPNLMSNSNYYVVARHFSSNNVFSPNTGEQSVNTGLPSAPSAPSNLSATTGKALVIGLEWDAPSNSDLRAVKVYRHTSNFSPTDDTYLVSTITSEPSETQKITFGLEDGLTAGTTYHFAVRAINHSGTHSTFTSTTTGSFTLVDAGDIDLPDFSGYFHKEGNTTTALTSSQFNTEYGRTPLTDDILIMVNTSATPKVSKAYKWNGSAFVEINNFTTGDLVVDGTLAGTKIIAQSISADRVDTDFISTLNLLTTSATITNNITVGTGNNVFKAETGVGIQLGHATFSSAPFSVTEAGVLKAESGTIGGINLASNKLYVGTGTVNNSNTAFYVDDSGNFSLKDKVYWNGTSLSVDGNITATTLDVVEANIQNLTLTLGGGILQDGSGNNLTVTSVINPDFPVDGLLHYFPLNGFSDPNDTTPADVIDVVSDVTGVITGSNGSFATDSPNGQSYVNGATTGITLLSDAQADTWQSTTGDYTVALWFKSTTESGDNAARIIGRDASDFWSLALDQLESGNQTVILFTDGESLSWDGASVNEWHHIALVVNGTTSAKLYVDGVLRNTDTDISYSALSRPVVLGCNTEASINTGANVFVGKLSDVRFYTKAITDKQVQSLYMNPAGGLPAKIEGDLFVTNSITADKLIVNSLSSLSANLGSITAGQIDIGSGAFTVNTAGVLDATGASINGTFVAGSGTNIFTADTNGIYLGNGTFANAPFKVLGDGEVQTTKTFTAGVAGTGEIAKMSGTGDYRFWSGSESPSNASFAVDKDGKAIARNLVLKLTDGTVYFDSETGFSDSALSQIGRSSNTKVTTVSTTTDSDSEYEEITVTANTDVNVTVSIDSNFGGFADEASSTTAIDNAEKEVPANFTLTIQHSSDGGANYSTVVTDTFTRVNDRLNPKTTPDADEYKINSNVQVLFISGQGGTLFLGSTTTSLGTPTTNVGCVDSDGRTTLSHTGLTLTGTSSGTTHRIKATVSSTDTDDGTTTGTPNYDAFSNNVTSTAPRVISVTDPSGDGFYVDNGSGSTVPPEGDITGVQITTASSGGLTGGANFTSGDATFTLALASSIDGARTFTNNVVIQGDLDVQGTTTTIDTTNLDVKDKNITLNYGTGDTSANADGAGITIQDAVSAGNDATLTWATTSDRFNFSHGLDFPDSTLLVFGDDDDFRLQHTGGASIIANYTGDLDIKNFADDSDIKFWSDDGSGASAIYFRLDGSMAGSGNLYTKWSDNSRISLGDSNDLRLYHNGTNSIILNATDADLIIQNDFDDKDIIIKSDNGSGGVTTYFKADGSNGQAQLFFYGAEKLNTTTSGIEITGSISSGAVNSTANITSVGTMNINANGTADTFLNIGTNTSSNHYAYIDLVGDSTYTDYGLRLIRNNTGANTSSALKHRGTGNLIIETDEVANIKIRTDSSDALTIDGTQNSTFEGNVYVKGAAFDVGENDAVSGTISAYGAATGGEGGELRLYTTAAYDTTYEFYRIDVLNETLRIGRQGNTDITIDASGNIEFGGSINSGAITSTSSITGRTGTFTGQNGIALEVNSGTTNVTSTFESGDATAWINLKDSNSGTYGTLLGAEGGLFRLRTNNNDANTDLTVDTSGNLSVSGTIDSGAITSSGDLAIDTDTLFVDVSTDRVGINNNSPSYPLDFPNNQSGLAIRVGDDNADSYMSFSNPRGFVGFDASGYMTLQGGNSKGVRLNVNTSTFGDGAALTIDKKRNPTDAGTINSGAITSSDNITADGTNAYILANRSATNRRSALVFTTNASDVNAQPPATATIDYALGVTDSDEVSGNKFFIKAGDTNASGSQFFLDSSGATFSGTINSGAITTTGALTIDVDNVANGALRIEANQTNPDNDLYFAQEIISTLSGTTATTGDREQGGIYIDLNSSATGGDTSNEHRVYGIHIDVDSTGDADLLYGAYATATATPTTGTTSAVFGGYFQGEDNGGAGEVTTVYGVQGSAVSDNSDSDANTMFGGYFKSYNVADSGNIGQATAVYGEIEIPSGTADIYGTSYIFRAEYDNNGTVAQTNTTYLYYGNYDGVLPTNAYGVYIVDAVDNYFAGAISSGAITSSGNLHAGDGTNISMDASANGQLEVDGDGYQGAIALDGSAMHLYHNSSSRSLVLGTNETARLTIGGTGGFNFHSNDITGAGAVSTGQISATTTADATPAIIATNTGGLSSTIARFVGESESLEIRQENSSGDYRISNTGQENGIVFYDGTAGVEVLYNGSVVQSWTSLGGTVIFGGIDATGQITTDSHVQSGDGSGGVALTINDGYGNANVTWNHLEGVPEQDGNAARIEVNTDSGSNATMDFELKSSVTSGVAVQTDSIIQLNDNGLYMATGKYIHGGGGVTINVDDTDFVVEDNTDSTTNFIWRDHSASKLYLGTSTAVVTLRSALELTDDPAYIRNSISTSGQIIISALNSSSSAQAVRWDVGNNANGAWRPDVTAISDLGLTNRVWDDLFINTIKIGANNDTFVDISRNVTANSIQVLSGTVGVGVDNTTSGAIDIYGGSTGNEGGEIRLHLTNDNDGTYEWYRIDAFTDDFRIGRQGQTDFSIFQDGKVKAENNFEVGGNTLLLNDVQIGDTVSQNFYGLLQVNQEANDDESGIGILSSAHNRSMRIWVDETNSYINSGNGGSGNLILNQGNGGVEIGTIESTANFPLAVKSGTNSHAISIEETSGSESWQLGVDSDGSLSFYNSGATTSTVVFGDSGAVKIVASPLVMGTGSSYQNYVVDGTSQAYQYLDTRDYMVSKGHHAGARYVVGGHSGQIHLVVPYVDDTDIFVDGVLKISNAQANGTVYQILAADLSAFSEITADKPISVMATNPSAPTMNTNYAGRVLGLYVDRYQPIDIYVYSPFSQVTVEFYRKSSAPVDVSSSSSGDFIYSTTIDAGQGFIFQEDVHSTTSSGDQYFIVKANGLICAESFPTGGDYTLLSPAGMELVGSSAFAPRSFGYTESSVSSSVTEATNGDATYYRDNTGKNGIFAYGTADGAGGDAEFAVPIEYLSDYYIYNEEDITNFRLVSYKTNTITVLDSQNDVLYTYDHRAATKSAPLYSSEGAASGSGGALSTDGPFKFIGTAPFHLVCQNEADDEMVQLGAMQRELYTSKNIDFKSTVGSPVGDISPFDATANTLTFLTSVAHQHGIITGATLGVVDLSTGELEITQQGAITIKADSIEADKIAANTITATEIASGTITGTQINTDLLNVKSFDNVSSTIVSHLTAGTKFPLAKTGQSYVQRTNPYTGSNSSFVNVTITEVRDNAGYVAIFSGVLGDVSGGRVQYSLNNSTWVNASGNTNISWSAGTYRGYTYVYTGQITTLSASQSTVYWRVYFSGSYNHTQLSLNVMMDNTR